MYQGDRFEWIENLALKMRGFSVRARKKLVRHWSLSVEF